MSIEGTPNPAINSNSTPQNTVSPIAGISNPEDFIFLQGKFHGNYHYPDLYVSMYRLGMNSEVEKAVQQLRYSLTNSAKESNGRNYIGNINWKQALSLNLTLDGRTLNPRQFADFLLLLKSGNAFNGAGSRVPEGKLAEILDEIITVRAPYRAEWLDADFKYLHEKLWLYSNHKLVSGNFDSNYEEELESCLMTKGNKIKLGTMNSQGMPIEEGNDFLYWCPDKDNNSVAGFVANFGGAYLYCYRYPADTDPSLGVRYVREAPQKNN